ncbi:MAG: pantoate--beta-alanine ligase [Cardiobacteriaceae bacterium]|nr:pantoate--beta-alanine ligase [Cardiobacteriaceae bacterium]
MLEVKNIAELKQKIKDLKAENKTIGLVPTMGFLHEGHGSLIKRARAENDIVVVSVFVNPKQFAANEDLSNYPRDLTKDSAYCRELNADILFIPDADEIYPAGFNSFADVYQLGDNLCGIKRAGHFRGVCTVIVKLFNLIKPNRAYFGQKDAQQLAIIKRITADFNFDVEVIGCPIVREADGLAKSSRNFYLNSEERKAATIINKAMQTGQKIIADGEKNTAVVLEKIRAIIESEKLARIDYLQAVDLENMQDIASVKNNTLFATAVFVGKARLLDNFLIENID